VLLFGKRLPEVGRSLGKGIVEFKKGLRGIEDEFMSSTSAPSTSKSATTRSDIDHGSDLPTTAIPKFEPPTSPPTASASPEMSSSPSPSYQD